MAWARASRGPGGHAAALDRGWTPASLILDEPVSVRISSTEVWQPANFDHRALGPIRLRTALVRSRNLAAVDLLDRVGVDAARTFITRFGFDLDQLPRSLTLALGSGTVSPLDMAQGYAVFANGGFRVEPHLIGRVEDQVGRTVHGLDAPRVCRDCGPGAPRSQSMPAEPGERTPLAPRVLEPRIAYQMHSMLKDVIDAGTGRRARALRRSDIAGKTGTTNDVRDAWFCGYQKELVTIAWMGFDDSAPLGGGETGGQSALGLWVQFMSKALAGKPEAELPVPPGMVQVRIDPATGAEVGPDFRGARLEWVLEENQALISGPDPVSPAGAPQSLIEAIY